MSYNMTGKVVAYDNPSCILWQPTSYSAATKVVHYGDILQTLRIALVFLLP